MNLSIKALLPEQERKPRAEKAEGEEGRKHSRSSRKDDEELSNWSEGSISVGTSLGEILANAEKKN